MAVGDFSAAQEAEIDRAIRGAETVCRFEFSVFVGPTPRDTRAYAQRLHAALASPPRSVLILVDPAAKRYVHEGSADVERYLAGQERDAEG